MIDKNFIKKLSIYEQGHELEYDNIYNIKNEHAKNKAFRIVSESRIE